MISELNWFDKYKIDNSSMEIDSLNLNDYIDKLKNKSNEKNVDYKIIQAEKEYQSKLFEITNLCNSVDKIKDIKTKSSLIILQKELDIIKFLTKYTLQNKNVDHTLFISCINILLDLSETLRIRVNQKEIIHDNQNELTITRCSYKFCSYQSNCSYNYNTKTKSLCYQDHYVHNMVSVDLKILIKYINKKNKNNNLILHNKEILKTINTLSFVIGHMETELRTKCLYLPNTEWESYHVVKTKN